MTEPDKTNNRTGVPSVGAEDIGRGSSAIMVARRICDWGRDGEASLVVNALMTRPATTTSRFAAPSPTHDRLGEIVAQASMTAGPKTFNYP